MFDTVCAGRTSQGDIVTIRTDPATIDRLAGTLRAATSRLAAAKPAPGADAGPSSAAVVETVAHFMRAAAGLQETTTKAADDLNANKATYASTEDANVGLFRAQAPR